MSASTRTSTASPGCAPATSRAGASCTGPASPAASPFPLPRPVAQGAARRRRHERQPRPGPDALAHRARRLEPGRGPLHRRLAGQLLSRRQRLPRDPGCIVLRRLRSAGSEVTEGRPGPGRRPARRARRHRTPARLPGNPRSRPYWLPSPGQGRSGLPGQPGRLAQAVRPFVHRLCPLARKRAGQRRDLPGRQRPDVPGRGSGRAARQRAAAPQAGPGAGTSRGTDGARPGRHRLPSRPRRPRGPRVTRRWPQPPRWCRGRRPRPGRGRRGRAGRCGACR